MVLVMAKQRARQRSSPVPQQFTTLSDISFSRNLDASYLLHLATFLYAQLITQGGKVQLCYFVVCSGRMVMAALFAFQSVSRVS